MHTMKFAFTRELYLHAQISPSLVGLWVLEFVNGNAHLIHIYINLQYEDKINHGLAA
jgi:hypothetical protein